jgi:hypothetical protein
MDIEKAFLTLLVMQSVEEGKLAEREFEAISDFYRNLGWTPAQVGATIDVLVDEMDPMTYKQLNKRLSTAAWAINNGCDISTKSAMIELLIFLAEADESVSDEEKEFVTMLARSWGVDLKPGPDAEGDAVIPEDDIK